MNQLTFDAIKDAWKKLLDTRENELKELAPDLVNPKRIYLKNIEETDTHINIKFGGFRSATQNYNNVTQIKRIIITWLRNISLSVQQNRSTVDTLLVTIDKESKLTEASISVYKRNPKTNKKQTVYKCIGGGKDGRKVSSPDKCIGIPDPTKKIKFGITKRSKYGQSAAKKKKTSLTNITAKRIRKANARLKKARGF